MKQRDDFLLRNSLVNGVYFASLLLLTMLACFFSEKIVHSIVSKIFFDWVVNTPSLKNILLFSFIVMFFAAGILQFVYEFEFVPYMKTQTQKKQAAVPHKNHLPAKIDETLDYYFLLDNSSSMTWNDENRERIKLLNKIIDTLSEERQIALVSFNTEAIIHMGLHKADAGIKERFKSILNSLQPDLATNIEDAFTSLASILNDDFSHKGSVIFISDGEDMLDFDQYHLHFNQVMMPFIDKNIAINTIFLNPENIDSSFLQEISSMTGGRYSTVRDPLELESEVINAMDALEITSSENFISSTPGQVKPLVPDPRRNLLDRRTGKRQNSIIYSLIHIAFITLTGLLLGCLLYTLFSHRDVQKPLLIGGTVSGLLAGIILETGLRVVFLPAFLVRFLACVFLSTLTWIIPFLYGGYALSDRNPKIADKDGPLEDSQKTPTDFSKELK
jgi:Ca-activated chloride channel family protein